MTSNENNTNCTTTATTDSNSNNNNNNILTTTSEGAEALTTSSTTTATATATMTSQPTNKEIKIIDDSDENDNDGNHHDHDDDAATAKTASQTTVTSLNASQNNGKSINNSEVGAGMATGSVEAEYKKIHERTGWHRLYQEIREKSEREATVKNYSTKESEKPKNRGLNRYRDVNPYDHSRIILHRGNNDYINANLVKVKRAGRQYILTQGPLSDTVGHFWLMVWEQNSRAILMLNKIIEKKQIKCHKYWPDHVDHPLQFPELKLTVEFVRSENYKNFLCRWFKLSDQDTKESRNIIQFHYITWPDFGIPSSPVTFLQFLKQVRKSGTLEPNVGPAVVHCSAGIGRSGTFCLVDCCLVLFEKEGEHKVSVQDVLFEMRRYRMGLIQTADQLYFSYQAIIEGIKLLKDPDFLNYDETPIIVNSTEDQSSINIMDKLLDNNNDQAANYDMDEQPPPLPPRTHSLLLPQTANAINNKSNNNIDNGDGDAKMSNIRPTDDLNNLIMDGEMSSLRQRPLPPLPPLPPAGHHHRKQQSLERVHESDSEENEFMDDDDDDDDDDDESLSDDDNADIAINEHNEENNMQLFKEFLNIKQSLQQQQQHQPDKVESNHIDDNLTTTTNNNNNTNVDNILKDLLNNATNINTLSNTTTLSTLDTENNMQRDLRRRKRTERRNNLEDIVKEIKRMQRESDAEAAKKESRFGFIERLGRAPLVAYLTAGVVVGALCVYAYAKMG